MWYPSTRSCRMKAAARSAPLSTMSPPDCSCSALISAASTFRMMVVFQSARSRVLENTILGMSRQMPANSTMGWVLAGSESAVGQNSAMSSWVTRPLRKALIVSELLVDVAVQFVVDHVPVDLPFWSLDEPVHGHRRHQDDLPHHGPSRSHRRSGPPARPGTIPRIGRDESRP